MSNFNTSTANLLLWVSLSLISQTRLAAVSCISTESRLRKTDSSPEMLYQSATLDWLSGRLSNCREQVSANRNRFGSGIANQNLSVSRYLLWTIFVEHKILDAQWRCRTSRSNHIEVQLQQCSRSAYRRCSEHHHFQNSRLACVADCRHPTADGFRYIARSGLRLNDCCIIEQLELIT